MSSGEWIYMMSRGAVRVSKRKEGHIRGVSGLPGSKYGSFNATGAVIRRSALGSIILRRSFSRPRGELVKER